MSDISCVVRSSLSDQFVLCVPSEYDYHYSSSMKTVICDVIAEYHKSSTGKPLEITTVDDSDLRTYVTTKAENKKLHRDQKVDTMFGASKGGAGLLALDELEKRLYIRRSRRLRACAVDGVSGDVVCPEAAL